MKTKRRAAFYVRVSTGGQTLENQKRELRAWAKRAGVTIVNIFQDKASGADDTRPGYADLMKAIGRRQIDVVAAWSVDRLSRSMLELVTLGLELKKQKVDLYLHNSGIDTSTPAGRSMFQLMGVFAELERELIRERVMAGLARARANGTKLGRPTIDAEVVAAINAFMRKNPETGIGSMARMFGVGTSVVQRLKRENRTKV